MRQETEGIVLSTTRFGDNKLVVNVYTRLEGKRGFLVRLPSKAGGKMRLSYFFPMNQLELCYDSSRHGSDLSYLSEAKLAYVYREMHADIRKSSVACFLAEVMGRCIMESEQDVCFYDKISAALRQFDTRQRGISEFHLFFLLALADSLGFYPQAETHPADVYFDLREGCFVSVPPVHEDFLRGEAARDLALLLQARNQSLDGFPEISLFDSSRRHALLQALSSYCRIQSGISGSFKSMEVLREVFR